MRILRRRADKVAAETGQAVNRGDAWSPAKRFWWNVATFPYRAFVGPFLTKLSDGTIIGSMTRWAVAVFTWAEYQRLVGHVIEAPDGTYKIIEPVQMVLPEAFVCFVILYALAIDKKLNEAPASEVVDLLGKPFGGGVDAGSAVTQTVTPPGSSLTQTVTPTVPEIPTEEPKT